MFSRRRFLASAAAAPAAFSLSAQQPRPACEETPLPPSILALRDRRKDIVPITVQEREQRVDLARELMKQYGIDAICITTGASLRYFTGASWGQSERLAAYVLPAAAAGFVVFPSFEATRLVELLKEMPEATSMYQFLWRENEDPFVILGRAMGELGMTTGTLGIEEHTQFAFSSAIAHACPALKIVPATPVTAGCRSHKSSAEIALLRLANQITFDVYKAVYLSCGPGDTNRHFSELVGKAYARCGVQGDASCNVGAASASPHGAPGAQIIREGDMVLIDDGCSVDGYQSDISRSFVYGKPSDKQREVFDIVHNAQSAALAAARPGVAMQAIDAAAREVIVKAGYGPDFAFFTHRVGHGIGLDMHEWPYLVGGNAQKLEPNMVFSDEPGIYIPDHFGIRLEDDMLITETGAELFTMQSPSLTDPFGIAADELEKKKLQDNPAGPSSNPNAAASDPAVPDAKAPAPVTPNTPASLKL